MKLKTDLNVVAFMNAVRKCSSRVCFDTAEGDHLDLRSTLSQFVFVSAAAGRLPELDAQISCSEEDLPLLLPYLEG